MNKKQIIIVLIIGSFLIHGCATVSGPLSLEYKRSIGRVAVVSVMGDNFEGAKIGTTAFNNEHFKDDFSGFAIDTKIETSIESYLSNTSNLNALIRSDMREEFSGAFGYQSKPKQSLERLKSLLVDLKSQGIDAVLVVMPYSGQFEDTPVWVAGYGFVVRTFLMMWYAKAHFIAKFSLIDTAKQEIIFDRFMWWWKDIKFSKWQRSFSQLTTTEQEEIKSFLSKVINSDLPKFLQSFNF